MSYNNYKGQKSQPDMHSWESYNSITDNYTETFGLTKTCCSNNRMIVLLVKLTKEYLGVLY